MQRHRNKCKATTLAAVGTSLAALLAAGWSLAGGVPATAELPAPARVAKVRATRGDEAGPGGTSGSRVRSGVSGAVLDGPPYLRPPVDVINDVTADVPDTTLQSEVSLALVGGRVVAAWNDAGGASGNMGFGVAVEGGAFVDRGSLPDPVGAREGSFFSDPVLAALDEDTVFVAGAAEDALGGAIIGVARSRDGGWTFEPPAACGQPAPGLFDPDATDRPDTADKPWLAVDAWPSSPWRGRVYCAFTNFRGSGDTQIQLAYASAAAFPDFGAVRPVSDNPQDGTPSVHGVALAVLADGTVVAAWEQIRDAQTAIRVARSSDGGETWGRSVVAAILPGGGIGWPIGGLFFGITGDIRVHDFPALAVDPAGQTVYLAWNDAIAPAGRDSEVFVSRSADGGLTWPAPVQVTSGPGTDQWLPALAVSAAGGPDGTVGVLFYDRSRDPESNWDIDVALATSTDGGRSWWKRRLTTRPFAPPRTFPGLPIAGGYTTGNGYMGDYNALVASGDGFFHAAWGDSSALLDATPIFPAGRPDPDIAYRRVPVASSDVSVAAVAIRDGAGASGALLESGGVASLVAALEHRGGPPLGDGILRLAGAGESMARFGGLSPGMQRTATLSVAVPSGLACGSTLDTTLQLTTAEAELALPLRLRVGELGARVERAYGAGALALPIPPTGSGGKGPGNTTEAAIEVSDPGEVVGVEVRLDVQHSFPQDLRIVLVAPGGEQVVLVDRRSGEDDAFLGTVLADDAPLAIADALAPYTGRFRPEQRLGRLAGLPAAGTWRLQVNDVAGWDTGTLEGFALTLTTASCGVAACPPGELGPCPLSNACGNGVIDPGESCDDGNRGGGDGCGATCNAEPSPPCTGDPCPVQKAEPLTVQRARLSRSVRAARNGRLHVSATLPGQLPSDEPIDVVVRVAGRTVLRRTLIADGATTFRSAGSGAARLTVWGRQGTWGFVLRAGKLDVAADDTAWLRVRLRSGQRLLVGKALLRRAEDALVYP